MDRDEIKSMYQGCHWEVGSFVKDFEAEISETLGEILSRLRMDFSHQDMSVGIYDPENTCETFRSISLERLMLKEFLPNYTALNGEVTGDDEKAVVASAVSELRRVAGLLEAALDTPPRP